jgi:hypothetical protein
MSDQILLDRIKNLESENTKLKAKSIRWQTVATNIGYWLRKNGDDIGAAAILIGVFGGIALIIAWFVGGWANDTFYLEFGNSSYSGGACIYQEYDWGKDTKVECFSNISDKPDYSGRIGVIRDEWLRVKNIGRSNE